MPGPFNMQGLRRRHAVWLITYLVAMTALVWYLFAVRETQISQLSDAAARQDWQTWREAARQQTGDQGPVKRKLPPSIEPPALVLLRDHFGVVVVAGLVFGSALFALMLFTLYGTLSRGVLPWGGRSQPDGAGAQRTESEAKRNEDGPAA